MAAGVFAPGHLGELTRIVPFELADAVLTEAHAGERRLRVLPSRVGLYFVLALGLFPRAGYLGVWAGLTAALDGLGLARKLRAFHLRATLNRIAACRWRRAHRTLIGRSVDWHHLPARVPTRPQPQLSTARCMSSNGVAAHGEVPDFGASFCSGIVSTCPSVTVANVPALVMGVGR